MKIRPVEVELFHVDIQTDGRMGRQTDRKTIMTKIIAAFRDFEDAPIKTKNLGLPFG